MAKVCPSMHVAKITKRANGKIYTSFLIRRSFREDGKVKHETIANISNLPPEVIDLIKAALQGQISGDGIWEVERNIPHGHVALVLGILRDIGLDKMIASTNCREKDIILALIASRIINPCSKLAVARSLREETATNSLGMELSLSTDLKDSEIYQSLDWLLARQNRIENKLARKHLEDGTLILYDLSSSYYTGEVDGLVQYGHSRDQKKGLPQIVYGLLCNRKGVPVSIEVFDGNTADPATLSNQIEKIRKRFKLDRVVLVGDRGMITSKRIDEELRSVKGLDWISALRNDAIKKLAEAEAFDVSLFDELALAEITSPDFPGERLVVCRNPLLAEKRARSREKLLEKTEAQLQKVVDATTRAKRKLKGQDKIGIRVGRVLEKCGMGKHFTTDIKETGFSFHRNQKKIDEEAALDGIYIIRTSLDEATMSAEETVFAYKNLSMVELAFRYLKQLDLNIRPIRHRLDDRIKSHVFLCMLAFYVEWHMRERLQGVLFEDEYREEVENQRESVVAPAPRSQQAKDKETTKRTQDDWPVHSLRTLLEDMGTLCQNKVRVGPEGTGTFTARTQPTAFQAQVFKLANVQL